MSSINQFYQEVMQDAALQQQFQAAHDRESLVNLSVELGQQKGYNFTSNEAEEWLKSAAAQLPSESGTQGELNEEELEAVAGGATPTFIIGGIISWATGNFLDNIFGGTEPEQ